MRVRLFDVRLDQVTVQIIRGGEHLLDLINDILDLSKIEAGKIKLTPQPLDPLEAVDQAVRLMRRRAEEKGLHLIVDGAAAPEIEADHRAVKQMLLNLISNAVAWSPAGCPVRVEAAPGSAADPDDGGTVAVRVIDHGPGIPPDQREDVFRPFSRLDEARNVDGGGTGLGLAIVAEIVAAHDGTVTIGVPHSTADVRVTGLTAGRTKLRAVTGERYG